MAKLQVEPSSHRLESLLTQLPRLETDLSSRGAALKSFPLIPKLPTELRCMIWAFIASQSRVVLVFDMAMAKPWPSNIKSQSNTPSIMHTSKVSRSEGLKFYELLSEKAQDLKSCTAHHGWPLTEKTKKLYINFKVDRFILCLHWRPSSGGPFGFNRQQVAERRQSLGSDRFSLSIDTMERIQHAELVMSHPSRLCRAPFKVLSVRKYHIWKLNSEAEIETMEEALKLEESRQFCRTRPQTRIEKSRPRVRYKEMDFTWSWLPDKQPRQTGLLEGR